MTRILSLLLTGIISLTAISQETNEAFDGHKWEAPYHLPVPNGWTIERFLIPISFAPQITYRGVEDIRFTPGWAQQADDEYWSYAFLWYLDGDVTVNTKKIEDNLHAYYTGLVALNGAAIPRDKVVPVATAFKQVKAESNDHATYTGTIKMTDYMTQKPVALNCKVHLRRSAADGKTYIFHELSPQPYSHKVWKDLGNLWTAFQEKKN